MRTPIRSIVIGRELKHHSIRCWHPSVSCSCIAILSRRSFRIDRKCCFINLQSTLCIQLWTPPQTHLLSLFFASHISLFFPHLLYFDLHPVQGFFLELSIKYLLYTFHVHACYMNGLHVHSEQGWILVNVRRVVFYIGMFRTRTRYKLYRNERGTGQRLLAATGNV